MYMLNAGIRLCQRCPCGEFRRRFPAARDAYAVHRYVSGGSTIRRHTYDGGRKKRKGAQALVPHHLQSPHGGG